MGKISVFKFQNYNSTNEQIIVRYLQTRGF